MSTLNDIFQKEVTENVPAKWQPFAIQTLSPVIEKYGTAEKIASAVKALAQWIVGTENLVAAYKQSMADKTEEQKNADADAAIDAQVDMVNTQHADNENARMWFTNTATAAAIVVLQAI